MNEQDLARLINEGQAVIRNQDAFFTNYDRTSQNNDEYSLKAEVFDRNNRKVAVIHAHVERQGNDDVITKAHVKTDHNGRKLFDLTPLSIYAAHILSPAFGPHYKLLLQ